MPIVPVPRLKVLTILGTRPEIIKLSRVMAELDVQFDHVLAHTGQNYDFELNQIFFDELGIREPDHFLSAAGASAAQTIGNVIIAADRILEIEKPDAVLLLGDTNSGLAVIAAKRRHIPVFHMEAGNRCFDERVPEEINRRIIDHASDINLVYTEQARSSLLAEGMHADRIIKTGSPMREVLEFHAAGIDASRALEQHGVTNDGYFVVSAHREENVDRPERLESLLSALGRLQERYARPIIVSVHPRTQQRLQTLGKPLDTCEGAIRLLKPLGFLDYQQLQRNAFCVLSDSGTLTEEASILDFSAVMLRDAHERPEGMDVGTTVMSGLSPDRIEQAVQLVRAHRRAGERSFRMAADYECSDVSRKVARIILGYRDYVMHTVWRERPV